MEGAEVIENWHTTYVKKIGIIFDRQNMCVSEQRA